MLKSITIAAFAAFAVFSISHPAKAQPRPAGGECEAMSEAYGPDRLWWGRFSGGRKSKWGFDNRGVEYKTAEVCFTSRNTCEAWLYRMRSDWQFMPRWSECGPGYAPGRPLRRPY
jgi:hypothetical protein